MTTAHAGLCAAIVTLLQTAPAVSDHIVTADTRPVPEQAASKIIVKPAEAEGDMYAALNGPINWDTTVELELYARSSTVDPLSAVDALLQAAWARLFTDPTLGGLIQGWRAQTRLAWDMAQDAQRMACVRLTLTAMHRTSSGVIT